MFCMCFHLEVVFSISFQKICNFYSAYGNAKYLKHRIEYVKFLFIASNKVLLLLKPKHKRDTVSNSEKNGCVTETVFFENVATVSNAEFDNICKTLFKWLFNHRFFVSTKKNFINHNSSRTTTNEWWAINAIWFVVERILATFFESLLHQNHVNEVFSSRVNCKYEFLII